LQITETLSDGLRREFAVTIPASEIDQKIEGQLGEIAGRVRLPGFRPGKVPPNLVKKMHGPALRREAIEAAVNDSVQSLFAEKAIRPATQPQVTVDGDGEGDLSVKVTVEVLPDVEPNAVEGIVMERLTVEPSAEEVDAALARLAEAQRRFEPASPDHAAASGDVVVADFVGSVGGEPFEGGKGEGVAITIGARQLIPGFEEQLIGAKANEQRMVKVTFPDDYGAKYLAGKEAEFEVTVAEVRTAAAPAIDEDFAKGLGLDSLEALREIMKDQVDAELGGLMRTYMKRKLLDHLAATHDFLVPQGMVEAEFQAIWKQLEGEAARDADPEAARAGIEADKGDYRKIAERRVRLGLLLSEIGRRASIEITQAEMNRLVAQEVSRYPQKEQQRVIAFFRENAAAAAQLRAPLYEDKVVDHLIGKATVTEKPSTREAIQAALESEEGALTDSALPSGEAASEHVHVHGPDCDHGHDHDHGAEAASKPKRAKKAAMAVDGGQAGENEAAAAEPTAEATKKRSPKPKPAA